MSASSKREADAIFRMMLYLKYELLQNGYSEEAESIQKILEEMEGKVSDLVQNDAS